MMPTLLIGLFLALLPKRFRQPLLANFHGNLRTAALISGIGQTLLSIGTLLGRYPTFFDAQMRAVDTRVLLGAAERGGDTAVRGYGVIILVAYILHPLSIALIYFAIEGVVRIAGVVASGDVVPTLPLALLDIGFRKFDERRAEKRQGARIPDLVTPAPVDGSGYHLAVASCRTKPGWDQLLTISYEDQLYEVADYVEGSDPRKHVYLLRHAPAHKVVRGLHHYDPEEVLQEK